MSWIYFFIIWIVIAELFYLILSYFNSTDKDLSTTLGYKFVSALFGGMIALWVFAVIEVVSMMSWEERINELIEGAIFFITFFGVIALIITYIIINHYIRIKMIDSKKNKKKKKKNGR